MIGVGIFNEDVNLFYVMFYGVMFSSFSGYLSGEWGGFMGVFEVDSVGRGL